MFDDYPRIHHLHREQLVPRPVDEVFGFFAQAGNLERITPPWLEFGLRTPEPAEMRAGTLIEYRLRVHGLPLRWVSRIEEWKPGRRFVDRQIRGPYRLWYHTHEFTADPRGTLIRDSVRYELPFGSVGALAHAALARRDLDRVFGYRRRQVERLFAGTCARSGS
jgi:ligand-binding SRPBCC domain-containing protein